MKLILATLLFLSSIAHGQINSKNLSAEGGICKSSSDCFGFLSCKKNRCTKPDRPSVNETPSVKASAATPPPPDPDHLYSRFKAISENGNFLLLWVAPTVSDKCPDWGSGYAAEAASILGEMKTIRELCYRVNDKKKIVEFKDPKKNFFTSTFSIPVSAFIQTKWPSEVEAERKEAALNAMRENWDRVMNREARENAAKQPVYIQQPIYFDSPRMPITCVHTGAISSCM